MEVSIANAADDPLPSWNDTASVAFVEQ